MMQKASWQTCWGQLTGNEYDMAGIAELRKLLGGEVAWRRSRIRQKSASRVSLTLGNSVSWGDCGSAYGGLSGKTKEDFGHGAAKFVPYTNVFDNPITDSNRLESIEKDSKQNEVRYGDALFTVSSETPEEVGMSSVWLSDQPNVYLNSFLLWLSARR